MKGYFSVGNSKKDIAMLLEEGVKDILFSYAFCLHRGLPEILQAAVKEKKINLMIDSGAFTNAKKPGTVTLEPYMKFLTEWSDFITEYVVLDDMIDRSVTLKNYKAMKAEGFTPQYVDHLWFHYIPELEAVYGSGEKAGWSGMDWISRKDAPATQGHVGWNKARFETRLAERAFKAIKAPKTQLHLFGVGQKLWRFLPHFEVVDSFDSSTWVTSVSRFGRIPYFQEATKDNPVPKFRQLDPNKPFPDDLRARIKSAGMDMRNDADRRRLAVRELLKYYKELNKFHRKAVARGVDLHPLTKCFTEEEAELVLVEIGKRVVDAAPSKPVFDISGYIPILKTEEERRLVTGIVLEPDEVDAQNDTIKARVIEEAAHKFLRKYNRSTEMGLMHSIFGNIGVELAESYVTHEDTVLGGQKVKAGSWLMTVKVISDKVWADVKSGKLTGFSIGGTAIIDPG